MTRKDDKIIASQVVEISKLKRMASSETRTLRASKGHVAFLSSEIGLLKDDAVILKDEIVRLKDELSRRPPEIPGGP